MISEYAFGPWLPDQTDFRNPGLEVVNNAMPHVDGFAPMRDFVGTGTTVSGNIIGAGSAFLESGEILVFVATQADLFVIRSGTATASSLSLSLGAADVVAFEQFNTAIYASTKNGDTWVLDDIETDNSFGVSAGSPPSANAMGRISDFLVMGDLTDIDTTDAPYRLRWSRFNNPQGAWDTDLGAQSGAIDLDAKYGPITAISGGSSGLIFQRQGVTRATFVGGAQVFDLDTFEENRGCVASASAVQVGEQVYYLAHDGFFVTDGATPRAISTGRVWTWFQKAINEAFSGRVIGAADYRNRCIVWAFPSGSGGTLNKQIWYNWETGHWGNCTITVNWLVEGSKSGLTLEQVGAIYADLDAMPLSLDSAEFQASGRNLLVIQGGELGRLNGPTLEASLISGDIHPTPGFRSYVSEAYPLVISPTTKMRLHCRDTMQGPMKASTLEDVGPIGFAPFSVDARYYRVETVIPAGTEWRDAYGFQVNADRSGAT